MKNKLKKFVFLMLLMIPFFVFADESKLASVHGIIENFQLGDVKISNVGYTKYLNVFSTNRAGIVVSANIENGYSREVSLELALNLYDSKKNFLKKITKEVTVPPFETVKYREIAYEDSLGFTLDKIGYYSLSCSNLSDVEIFDKGKDDKYYIDNFDIDINVLPNNVYEVDENYDITYASSISPFVRGIPLRVKYTRMNGTKENKRAVVGDIEVKGYRKTDISKGIKYIHMGKEDKTGKIKDYNLKYNYNVGRDNLEGNDEFAFYLANDLGVKCDGVNFRVNFPKPFKREDVYVIDENGVEVPDVYIDVQDNMIIGRIDKVVGVSSKYLLYVKLEDGYFTNASKNVSNATVVSFVLPLCFLVITIIWYILDKKNFNKVVCNSCYFDEDINSLEMGYLYKGKVKGTDIASLLFHLANKGYIKIVKDGKSYKVVKVKNYDSNNRCEMAFMKEFFYLGDELSRDDVLNTLGDLKEIMNIKLDSSNIKKKIYIPKFFNYKLIHYFMMAIIVFVNVYNLLFEYQPSVIVLNTILSSVGYFILVRSVTGKSKVIEKILNTLVALILIVSPIVLTSYGAYLQDTMYTVIYVSGVVISLLIGTISTLMSNKTSYGKLMYNKINAYKKYLVNVSSKSLVSKDFYNVLPYTLVLGISDTWVDKFRNKKLSQVKWYKSNSFSLDEFYLDVMNIYSDAYIGISNKEE